MKKSNKGFTMVELLAAVVILGLLAALAIPLIMSLMDNSRNKIYISDAKKLVAQAEYKLKANNSSLELPDEDNCIVVSLVYLNSSIFNNPPNGGTYLKENSFVVIKNIGNNKYEYSVMLVEKYNKNGYRGVELISDTTLNSSDANRHVVNFKSSDLIEVSNIQKSYINQKLGTGDGDYINEIEERYNEPDFDDNSTLDDNDYIPKITSLSLTSSNSMGYNLLNAELQMRVVDKDTPYTNLVVYLSTKGYDEADDSTKKTYRYCADADNCSNIFSKSINFTEFGNYTYDGTTINLYVVVRDDSNNETRKTVKYTIHKNTAPRIDESASSITKRDYDNYAMTTAQIKLAVTDDIDKYDELKVCFKESVNANDPTLNECSNYQKFTDVFNDGENGEYKFNCGGSSCARDGSTHYLAIFVKDSLEEVSSVVLNYTFSINSNPTINNASIVSREEPFTSTKSKEVYIRVDAKDQEDSLSHLKIIVSGGKETKTYNYNESGYDNYFDYTIADNYPKEGESASRNITVRVEDSEGAAVQRTIPYELFVDKPPTITINGVTSYNFACPNSEYCPLDNNGNGSKKINFDILVKDAIDYEDDKVYVCITDTNNSSNCTVNNNYTMTDSKSVPRNNYIKYSELKNKLFNVEFDNWSYYDDTSSNKTIYVFAKDSQGLVSSKTQSYKLYKNKAPEIKELEISNRGVVCLDENNNVCTNSSTTRKEVDGENSYNVHLDAEVKDDFNENNSLKYCVTDGDSCTPTTPYQESIDFDISSSANYNDTNNQKSVKLFVMDANNKISSKTIEYEVYKNKAPSITTFKVYSNGYACENSNICPNECEEESCEDYAGGSNKIDIQIDLNEDFDKDEFLNNNQICISEENNANSCTYESYSEFNNVLKSKTYNWNYDGSKKKLYAFAKDSMGVVSEGTEVEYKLYKNQAPIINYTEVKSDFESYDEEVTNIPHAIFRIDAEDDFTSTNNLKISYCYKIDNGNEVCPNAYKNLTYTEEKQLDKDFFSEAIGNTTDTTTQILSKNYKIYAKVADESNNTKTTDALDYKTVAYTDQAPIIYSVDIESSDDRQNLIISTTVYDPDDYYSICIGTDQNNCTDYITEGKECTDGTCESERLRGNGKKYYFNYQLANPITNGETLKLYAFVKDIYNKKGRVYDDEGEEDATVLAFPYTVYDQQYNTCSEEDLNGLKKEYTYQFDPEKDYEDEELGSNGNIVATHTYRNKKITPTVCERKCYHYDEEDNERNIFGFYDRTISYFDRFDSNVSCPAILDTTDYKAYCDFIDCFKFDDYSKTVIGTTKRYEDQDGDPIDFTVEFNNKVYVCDYGYKKYQSNYTNGNENITLIDYDEIMCGQIVDDSSINLENFYPDMVRVVD